ncbi:hypothetical protein B0A55_02188 [Friedmanniomyces simplex]|uniref:RNA helicase n=1 Tax=Friedmanniomyces simplex TaxID=329884 RepID=A0A4U0XX22_9PEZI|nr:hypothetical protein B0A55_02188 [Friedmanniomyces simplex]
MLPIQRPLSRCIYCAFRTQQRALLARRLRSTRSTKRLNLDDDDAPPTIFPRAGHTNAREGGARHDGSAQRSVFPNLHFRPRPSDRGHQSDPTITLGHRRLDAEREAFDETLHKRMAVLEGELQAAPMMEQLRQDTEGDAEQKDAAFKKIWKKFSQGLRAAGESRRLPWGLHTEEHVGRGVRKDLQDAYRTRGMRGLDERIKYAFYGQVTGTRFTESDIRNQKDIADLRYPAEWFPATRGLHRTVHLHVGPTNSGKTYQALQRLESATTGAYAGPLRLLAHEVYSRLNAKGRPCSLITGEERRGATGALHSPGDPSLSACTVEMMPLNKPLDVAVIDEIQMIGNPERGWAWTQALLGVKAKEVHLCGEERTIPLIRELCASVRDKLEIHRYERLSPLKLADHSMNGDLKQLRKGDCIVSFSIMGIHALRKQIEKQTGRKVATVYGSLPPETRAQQARLFNDPDNDYDFLVASDAVGMGLNLAIKRIIFEASSKYDGFQQRTLGVADIKQIAGRAGRYRTAQFSTTAPAENQDLAAAKGDSPVETAAANTGGEPENVGLVTTLEPFDFPVISAAMSTDPEPISTAGLFPPSSVLERFSSYFPPGTPFSYILTRLHELSQMHSRFHLCGLREQIWIADLIEPVPGLTISDRNIICSAPASKNEDMWKTLMPAFARCIAAQAGGNILEIPELPLETLEAEVSASREYLRALEQLHKGIVSYLWLSYRFAGIFSTRALAQHIKGMVEERIEEVLGRFSFSETERRKLAERREREVRAGLERAAAALKEEEAGEVEEERESDDLRKEELGIEEKEGTGSQGLVEEVVEPLRSVHEGGASSVIAGGDHFAGEADLAIEDPAVSELIEEEEEKPGTLTFAEWRAQQTRGESQASREKEEDHHDDNTISAAFQQGERKAAAASEAEQLEEPSEERPSIADVDPEIAAEASSSAQESISDELEAPVTPETELSEAPLETQAESPQAVEPRTLPEQTDEVDGGPSSSGKYVPQRDSAPRVPAGRLAYEDVDHAAAAAAEQGERHAESRA